MKNPYQFLAAWAALAVAASALLTTPAQARHRVKRSHRTSQHATLRRHMTTHRSAGAGMSHGMTGGATGTSAGNANPAMSTAPATSGGDKM